jgi:hypothetical protein
LAHVSDPLDLVLTPFILSNFEPQGDGEFDRRSLTAGWIMDQTMRQMLRRSQNDAAWIRRLSRGTPARQPVV